MFHHIRKFSSTVKASPISAKNNKKVVREVMDKTRFINEYISIRPVELTDVDDIMVWASDKQLSGYCRWKTYRCKEDSLEDIKNNIIPHPWYRAICLNDRPIGKVSVDASWFGKDILRAQLSYVVAPKYWGKGIATTAVEMVLDTVFEKYDLKRIEALVDVENLAALRVLEKAGFLKEGVLRKYDIRKGKTKDMAIFSFLSTD